MGCFAFGLVLLLASATVSAEESVPAFLERYERALDHADLEALGEVYAAWTAERAAKLARYFGTVVTEFDTEFHEVEIERVSETEARVRFLRRDRFTDRATGRRIEKSIRLQKQLQRINGRWRVASVP